MVDRQHARAPQSSVQERGDPRPRTKGIGYDGYLVVEVPTLHKDADKIARDNLSAIREWIQPL